MQIIMIASWEGVDQACQRGYINSLQLDLVTLSLALGEAGWNHFEKRASPFSSLWKHKTLSGADGKYVLAAASEVIAQS